MAPRAEHDPSLALRGPATIATALGALGSLGLLMHAAGPGVSHVLMFVMTIWTVAPFAALELARRLFRSISPAPIFVLAFVIATGSLVIYGIDAVRPLSSKAAFPYVVVPLSSWALMAVTVLTARLRPNRNNGTE
jgi:hypothetical protein